MLAAAVVVFALTQSLVTPVLPTIAHDLHTTSTTVTWVLTAWLLASSVSTPILGRIGDAIGKDRTVLVALAAIAVGCLLAAIAPNIGILIVGRVLQGVGAAVFPVSFGILRDEYPQEKLHSAVGIMAAVIAAASGTGIVLAGPIVSALNWRFLFWFPMIATVVIGILAWRLVPASKTRHPGKINWLAAILLSGWLVALLLPLTDGSEWGWSSGRTLGLFALAVVLFVAWVVSEVRSSSPLIDMRMMRLPAVWTTNAVALIFGAGMFGIFAFLPQLMQVPTSSGYGFGASVTRAGLLMLPMMGMMAIVGSLSGPLTRWVPAKAQLITGAGLTTLMSLAIAFQHDAEWKIAVFGGIFGVGLGLIYSPMINLIVQNVPKSQTSVASGMNTNIRTIGASIGTAVVSSVVAAHTLPSGLPADRGFTLSFTITAVAEAAAFFLAMAVPAAKKLAKAPEPEVLPELSPVEL
ncbi:drug resistance transporter, EmrB/QacA subfamily [Asanoa hainanensis]|uniref:Drug resistance transporter, EmrB/QacA subfamily n=1 Tax=Asanoa hainanensis TaxID=560556 RepID=A0A239P823_9ACTN|nr:drug resistance transporter, EmrB/QacA subfamily [Asanoa hainanensis]